MIHELLVWWVRQLRACVPARLRAPEGPPDATTVAVLPDGGLAVGRRRAGQVIPLGTAPAGPAGTAALRAALGPAPGRIAVQLPPGSMLRRPVELPLAAERSLGQVLAYEMDRLTPFAAAELDWTWSDLRRDRARGQVRLALLLVPRAASAGVLAALRAAGAQPALLEGEEGTVPLDRASQSKARRRSWALAAGAASCGLLALVAAGLPFLRQSADLRRVERRIQALRPDVDRVDALRRRIAGSVAGADVLAAQRAATGEVLAALALVTDILPDDTYLSEFGWRSRTLTLSGQSAAAARLIGALSASPTVRNPTFAAPVIRDEAARADRFSIRAEIAAEGTP